MRIPPQAVPVSLILVTSVAIAGASLQSEIEALMESMGWPEMVRIALKRGDLQKAAKLKLPEPEKAACIDNQYTEQKVLSEIAAGYAEIYNEPDIVADTTKFMSSPGAKRILAAVASRAPAVGASAAHEENKSSAWSSLTPDERDRFSKFSGSTAGKIYVDVRFKQTQVHQGRLARLVDEVVQKCSK